MEDNAQKRVQQPLPKRLQPLDDEEPRGPLLNFVCKISPPTPYSPLHTVDQIMEVDFADSLDQTAVLLIDRLRLPRRVTMARLMGTSIMGPACTIQKAPFDSREGFNKRRL